MSRGVDELHFPVAQVKDMAVLHGAGLEGAYPVFLRHEALGIAEEEHVLVRLVCQGLMGAALFCLEDGTRLISDQHLWEAPVISRMVEMPVAVHHREFPGPELADKGLDIADPHAGVQDQGPVAALDDIYVHFLKMLGLADGHDVPGKLIAFEPAAAVVLRRDFLVLGVVRSRFRCFPLHDILLNFAQKTFSPFCFRPRAAARRLFVKYLNPVASRCRGRLPAGISKIPQLHGVSMPRAVARRLFAKYLNPIGHDAAGIARRHLETIFQGPCRRPPLFSHRKAPTPQGQARPGAPRRTP